MNVDVSVSSFKVDVLFQYTADKLLDGDPTTAWAGGSISAGDGQWMEFTFDIPLRVAKLGIFNGHQGEGKFDKFRRIRSGRIVYPDGTESPFWLRDEAGEQVITCPNKPTKSLKIIVDEVFPKDVPLAKVKLAVSEIKFYLTYSVGSGAEQAEEKRIPASPPAETDKDIPVEIIEVLKEYYVRLTTLSEDYHLLFAPHVRDKHDLEIEYLKSVLMQRGTFHVLRTAEVDTSGLGFELVYLLEDVAEVRVFGAYRVKVADLDKNLEEDSHIVLMSGNDGWQIVELVKQGED